MTPLELKTQIERSIMAFSQGNLRENGIRLFKSLGYSSDRQVILEPNTFAGFVEVHPPLSKINRENALVEKWLSVDILFQLTGDDLKQMTQGHLIFDKSRIDNQIIESSLFLAIELTSGEYSRSKLAGITREVNKFFAMPVMILFKNADLLTLSIINRRLNKHDESKDVLEKVTLIKEINIKNPVRAHIEILSNLALQELTKDKLFHSFVELHHAWQQTLDISELNKKFYREIANWYFYAVEHVEFPKGSIEDRQNRNATNIIRLITRMIFVWFIKEKGLVPEELFDLDRLKKILYFNDPQNSTYYKAILQNLFFATLNTEMGPGRRFRGKNKNPDGMDAHYGISTVYRYEDYFIDPQKGLNLFAGIPFLNGGLFECLDKRDEKILVDGFSDDPRNQPTVPDSLFFGDGLTVDMSDVYGDKHHSKENVRGLICIFNNYKFTIEENTPLDEEVALDPELLGKVFENLLAAYNPETGTTARKQTGSFYTPREIVNYMVDESLIAYLENSLGGDELNLDEKPLLDARLRHLLAYNNEPHQFTGDEANQIISAIDKVKVLDPTCGSGAFPMGVLHKLVFILNKLDPGNVKWKERQLAKAAEIPDSVVRGQVIEDIEKSFAENELDYGRKLYLIENCIYGVDIQPIAVQIAKLRFFISLVVDQRVESSKPNLGIRPLPNLESKFVAANTLIGIVKPQQMLLHNPMIDEKEKQLAEVRDSLFTARTPATKQKYREMDRQLREEIAELLKTDGWNNQTATLIAKWDPYDQNTSAEFFDAEWMFSLVEGFDIVIGNPPYVSYGLRNAQKMSDAEKEKIRSFFPNSAEYKISLYALFIDKSITLSKHNFGIQTLIVPDSFLLGMYFSKIRKLILRENWIRELLWIPSGVFDAVVGFSVIYLFQRKQEAKEDKLVSIKSALSANQIGDRNFQQFSYPQKYFSTTALNRFRLFFSKMDKSFVEKIESNNKVALSTLAKITTGVRSKVGKDQVIAKFKKSSTWKRGIISSGQVFPYIVKWNNDWLNINGEVLCSGGWDAQYVEKPKVMIRQTGDSIIAGIDTENLYHLNNVHTCSPLNKNFDVRLLSAILNSKLMKKYYHLISLEEGRTLAQTDIETLEKLPFPFIDDEHRTQICKLVDEIISIKRINALADTTNLEDNIDLLVYDIYGLNEEDIKLIEGKSVNQINLGSEVTPEEITDNVTKRIKVIGLPLQSDYDLYKCSLCGKLVIGHDRENHTKENHHGQAQWVKLKK